MKKLLAIFVLVFVLGCAQSKDFKYGVNQINSINSKYNTNMETYPSDLQQIDSMLAEYEELRKLQLEKGKEQFNYVIDYRILNLEAEKFYIQGQRFGMSGTTKDGFGCKQRPLIIESAGLRNSSALKGFAAVDLLREFVQKYPEEANFVNLSDKNALFLNATFYQISRDAKRDSNIINSFCPKNTTLEIYQQEFRKNANLSEEYIKSLTYEEAAELWKRLRGIQ